MKFGKLVGGNTHTHTNCGIKQIITSHGGDEDVLTKGSFWHKRWTKLTHLSGIDDTSNALLQPFCGICILSRQKHVEATRRDASKSQRSPKPLRGLSTTTKKGWIRNEERSPS